MGCCASKCRIKTPNFALAEDICHVQDKLVVVSQQPPLARTPPIFHYHSHHSSNRISPIYPLSPTASSSSSTSDSLPSFSRSRRGSSLNNSSSSSCSSVLTSKDRSFSNEFLWSCLKENPHVLYLNSIKESIPESPAPKQGTKQSVNGYSTATATPQKRVRSVSPAPSLTRQKSFRRDPNPAGTAGSRMLMRSPSPSRRFGDAEDRGIQTIANGKEMCSKRMVGSFRVNGVSNSVSPYVKRDYLKPAASPCLKKKNRETFVHRISSKIDELAVAEAMARHEEGESDAMEEEDIDNPLIALDCFIFL